MAEQGRAEADTPPQTRGIPDGPLQEPPEAGAHSQGAGGPSLAPKEKAPSAGPEEQLKELRIKIVDQLNNAAMMKDWAIAHNYVVPTDVIEDVDELIFRGGSGPRAERASRIAAREDAIKIDMALMELVNLTYPQSQRLLATSFGVEIGASLRQKWLFWTAVVGAAVASLVLVTYGFSQSGRTAAVSASAGSSGAPPLTPEQLTAYSVLALGLGLLGALVYILVNLTSARALNALSASDVETSLVRILLGPLVGWVFYFGFSQ